MNPAFFPTPAAFRKWLAAHHATASELLVGFYKRDSGRPSLTWPESVDEALCHGWIDGVRRRLDDVSYTIRFSPRKAASVWSAVNIRRARALIAEGRMRAAGKKAFDARKENRSGVYSYEQRGTRLEEPYASLARKNAAAWTFFEKQPPSYKKMVGWYVISAKKDETRRQRLEKLIRLWERGLTGRERGKPLA